MNQWVSDGGSGAALGFQERLEVDFTRDKGRQSGRGGVNGCQWIFNMFDVDLVVLPSFRWWWNKIQRFSVVSSSTDIKE